MGVSVMKTVVFRIHYRANPGQCLNIVGSSKNLGYWKSSDSTKMKWTDGDWWEKEVYFPGSSCHCEYKYLLTTENGVIQRWEDRNNRNLTLEKTKHHVILKDTWNCISEEILENEMFKEQKIQEQKRQEARIERCVEMGKKVVKKMIQNQEIINISSFIVNKEQKRRLLAIRNETKQKKKNYFENINNSWLIRPHVKKRNMKGHMLMDSNLVQRY